MYICLKQFCDLYKSIDSYKKYRRNVIGAFGKYNAWCDV